MKATESAPRPRLPLGVRQLDLPINRDLRGSLIEVFEQQRLGQPLLQWNAVFSQPGVLRGMHIHDDRSDYIVMLRGRMLLGLYDARTRSPSYAQRNLIELRADAPSAVYIPPGVLHGFYFPEGGLHMYGLGEYWRPHADIGCRWDDPELALAWPCQQPTVVPRDLELGALHDLHQRYPVFGSIEVAAPCC
ncbi:dTDP-4-dehydrorhamnose 3,5-epimerase family protein [Pseudomarimonas arenosa]|uniref:dTDP-4-dehydrorhamnose 3,5-epimerase n=1 Tax=Pseudomarimonas arenosa TaxID=2774145 RepID=A0AAW3ZGC5_9GAMM|nr:dTDP-4-dehydrorhamnose 3,5-epimerase family protein [Pseudomarimonas arenosa]MBD8524480.1 dTDP-4-dehydrorhamnose 3,5-epimerase family protein [Pseudomarimonas arenosa]